MDKTTKWLLVMITVALWMNVLDSWFHPISTAAQSERMTCNGDITAGYQGGYKLKFNCH